ncbi:sodium/potassium/calcium exchanger 4-like [Tribolium madens]|uniref:sodium/potassium/calcium exchanger 4-like n=1 Tax=Tribolium madens TaxID=41895 RepID=UPI001CF75588|nr:sodium/potassium/calcium exchanger 4-like [Tribolium madens]XP_044267166.1 sodium/potassium/calcium exchanger 4-like [Tribolium madens]XP_044267167.1 sodium/potassium/calcium exchanger 4-like [Tribolium madens]XP_044267168.1 sodium/potassium/calcium exchanger 4-like [Tribolium madens]XP_044267169.1 sodium/potassium/calcium exchanger 4-like [Tribolium madens]
MKTLICVIILVFCLGIVAANDTETRKRHRRYIILSRTKLNATEECSSSSDDFLTLFTEAQVEKGGIIVVFCIGIYCFTLLAIICDNYFLPCVEKICEALNLSHDVAAATFMSVATSTPELFVNIIGTFITESDIGIGTVVGSSLFNTLGVASLGSLAASSPVQLHWWPISRDVIIYILSILLLVSITWDGVIYWYEGLILFLVYFIYFTVMFQNVRISKFVLRLIKRDNKISDCEKGVTPTPRRTSIAVISSYGSYAEEQINKYTETKNISETTSEEENFSLFRMPKGSIWKRVFFFYSWPIKFILFCTVPDPQRYPKLFPVTFILCIFWIGSNSYVVSWMIAIIGNMFNISDAVLGLTFLAAGGCLPEAISITIMSRRGEGSMGVSNSLGANTMNILLSLGMPWFLKTIVMGTDENAFIQITSGSIEYTISALIPVAIILYLTFYFNKFQMCRRVGIILISVYTICIILAILAEMVFFKSEDCPTS